LVDVRADVVESIAERGVAVGDEAARRVEVTRDPARVFGTQFLFLFVRAPDTLGAVRPFAGQMNPATPIVSLQNGLGNEEAIKTGLGGTVPLVLGVTTEASLSVGHGRATRLASGTTLLGSGGASLATLQSVAGLLEDAGMRASLTYDIRPHLWGKLLVNAAINPVAALLDRTNGAVVSDADAADLARNLLAEGVAVARALGVALPFEDPWNFVCASLASTASARNSMTIDLEAHRPSEIDQINGALVATGRRHGIPTPYNDAVVRLVRAKQRGGTD
jgi:2-dehydropantoate 2-reductase